MLFLHYAKRQKMYANKKPIQKRCKNECVVKIIFDVIPFFRIKMMQSLVIDNKQNTVFFLTNQDVFCLIFIQSPNLAVQAKQLISKLCDFFALYQILTVTKRHKRTKTTQPLESCHLVNWTFEKLPLWKLSLGKSFLEKFLWENT